jgi:hypothetical protein
MAEMSTLKRTRFPAGKQRLFLERVGELLTIPDMAHACGLSERTVRDWRREKFSMPFSAVELLSKRTHIPIPKGTHSYDARDNLKKASKKGTAATLKKYGRIPHDERRRKERWQTWWESKGKFIKNPIFETKSIRKPRRSAELAECIGILMGDGGISAYQVTVTLHHVDDLEYAAFVSGLIERLFKVTPRIYHVPRNSVNNITVSRKELVQYLHELGLPIGNKVKQQLDMPLWIREDRRFAIACLRGLVDTDGCIFTHIYRVKGTNYSYKKLSFTSASKPLLRTVNTLLEELGFHPRIAKTDVRLDRIEDMKLYFSMVGTHNPKHLRRYGSAVR